MGYGIFGQNITGIRDIKTPLMGPQKSLKSFQLGSRSDVTSSPTQIPLCAVVNIEIACSNACRNARILSIEIIFSLMKSREIVDFFKRKNWGGGGVVALYVFCYIF